MIKKRHGCGLLLPLPRFALSNVPVILRVSLEAVVSFTKRARNEQIKNHATYFQSEHKRGVCVAWAVFVVVRIILRLINLRPLRSE